MGDTLHNYGGFNHLRMDEDGFVIRTQKPGHRQAETIAQINAEYSQIGFDSLRVGYRLRTIAEQVEFARALGNAGVAAIKPEQIDERSLAYEFVPGVTIDQKLSKGDYNSLPMSFGNLLIAHDEGISIGDRWTKNTVIMDDQTGTEQSLAVEIDFDIELTGPLTARRTVDLGQTIYHMLHFAKSPEIVIDVANEYLAQPKSLTMYDHSALSGLLRGQADYFAGLGDYEGFDAVKTWRVIDTCLPLGKARAS